MRIGDRIAERRKALDLSQSQLAQASGVSQPTIGKLEAGITWSSKHTHRIARALSTTVEYLTGEIDDPDEGAPPPPPEPTVQHVMMPVALPAEAALTRMFLGLLRSLEVPDADAIAPELAKLLPTGLQTLKGPLRFVASDDDESVLDPARARQPVARVLRQQSRT